jgi:alpha-tubulin suppressor-like RCC1 family protein
MKTLGKVSFDDKRSKLNKHVEEVKDRYALGEMIKRGKGETKGAFNFSPYQGTNILTIEKTNKMCYALLKSGTIISLGGEDNSNTNKKSSQKKSYINLPMTIKTPTAIINLVCGREHCLAVGKSNKVYSWGSNSYGQLGIISLKTDAFKEDPTEIVTLNVNFYKLTLLKIFRM